MHGPSLVSGTGSTGSVCEGREAAAGHHGWNNTLEQDDSSGVAWVRRNYMAASLLCSFSPASASGGRQGEGPIRKPYDCLPHQFRQPPVAALCATFSFNFISTWVGCSTTAIRGWSYLDVDTPRRSLLTTRQTSIQLCFRREIFWPCEADL